MYSMVKDRARMIFDIVVLVAIGVAIYIIKAQSGAEGISPAEGVMSLLGIN